MTTPTLLNLTTGAASLLGQIAGIPGLITDAKSLYRVGSFAENHLSDLGAPPAAPAAGSDKETIAAWEVISRAWAAKPVEPVAISEGTKQALAAAVEAACAKGMLPANIHTNVLLRELGLAVED
jgi:hypothetical protein